MSLLSKTATGPLGWIKEGTLDISLSITLPTLESTSKHRGVDLESQQPTTNHNEIDTVEAIEENEPSGDLERANDTTTLEMRFDVMFNHLFASAPLYTPELSYLNNAMVHPILAYINTHNKHIPLSFKVQLPIANLDGARSPAEAGLWDALSNSVALAFGKIVQDSQNTETLHTVANTLLKDCWMWVSGWVYSPPYVPTS